MLAAEEQAAASMIHSGAMAYCITVQSRCAIPLDKDLGVELRHLGSGIWNLESGIWDQAARSWLFIGTGCRPLHSPTRILHKGIGGEVLIPANYKNCNNMPKDDDDCDYEYKHVDRQPLTDN